MENFAILYNKSIRSHFSTDREVLICLFPFCHQVFAEHFNWEANLRLTYPLLKTNTWEEVSNDIGFNSMSRLAKGILELQEPFKTELKEYSEWKKIKFPDYATDRIPLTILIALIQYFQKKGLTEIRTIKMDRFPNSETRLISFENKDKFEIYNEIKNAKAFTTENGITIMLPDYDCPYAILSASKETCADIVKTCKLEYLKTNNKTQFDWWNQEV